MNPVVFCEQALVLFWCLIVFRYVVTQVRIIVKYASINSECGYYGLTWLQRKQDFTNWKIRYKSPKTLQGNVDHTVFCKYRCMQEISQESLFKAVFDGSINTSKIGAI